MFKDIMSEQKHSPDLVPGLNPRMKENSRIRRNLFREEVVPITGSVLTASYAVFLLLIIRTKLLRRDRNTGRDRSLIVRRACVAAIGTTPPTTCGYPTATTPAGLTRIATTMSAFGLRGL